MHIPGELANPVRLVWFLASIGRSGIKKTAIALILAASINIVLNIYLIPIFGILGAITSTMLAYLIPNFELMYRLKNLYRGTDLSVIENPQL